MWPNSLLAIFHDILALTWLQWPRLKDEFEMFLEYRKNWVEGHPSYKPSEVPQIEAAWVEQHKKLGNLQ